MSTSFRLTAIEARRHRLAVWVAALAAPVIGWAAEPVDLAVAAGPTSAAQQPAPDKFLRSARPVPNFYTVVLKEDALRGKSGLTASSDGQEGDSLLDEDEIGRRAEEVSARLASAHNGWIGYVYKYTIRGFSVEMAEEQARALSEHPDVEYVEEEAEVSLQSSQFNAPWGLDRIDQRTLPLNTRYDYFPTGDQVNVYVIDTGIRFSHSEFGGRATVGADFVNDGKNGDDCHGHGTHVAGIIGGKTYGVAKDVRLISVRVANCYGEAQPAAVIAAIDWVTKNHSKPAVVNMSLTAGGATAVDAIKASISKGITYVIAAGNANATSPVSVDEAIVVGATDDSGVRPTGWPWCDVEDKNCGSDYGPVVNVFAPGVDIVSAWPDGVALAPYFQMVNTTSGSRAASMSRTSQAAPSVTGIAALHLQMGVDPGVIQQKIISSAVQGAVIDPGPGTPNRLLQTKLGGVYFADVDDDKMADAIVVGDNKITVRRSNGGSFLPNENWTTNPYFGNRGTFFADVTGDGKTDAIAVNTVSFPPNTHSVTVRRSDGSVLLARYCSHEIKKYERMTEPDLICEGGSGWSQKNRRQKWRIGGMIFPTKH
ncbi:MAG: S8 family serine peptidase, partial [Candidatus Competibacter sp.]|nr:S8 family serine peptidase [Candidatus Competibacter sp.]